MKRILLLLALSLLSQPDFATGGPGSPESAPIQVTQSSTVPTVHNQRLDDLYRKYASNEEEVNQVNSMVNEFYKNYGTFLASAVIQHELDRQQLYTLFDEDTKTLSRINPKLAERVKEFGPDFYKAVKPIDILPRLKTGDSWMQTCRAPEGGLTGALQIGDAPPIYVS